MSQISAAAVKALRDCTNAPMMECKAALVEANGDMEKAVEIIRKKLKGVSLKREGNVTAEGRIGVYIDPVKKVGGIVEVQCESAPTAKNELFVQLANDLAKHVALKGGGDAAALQTQPFVDDPKKTLKDRIDDVIGLIRENMRLTRGTQLTGLLGSYVHHDGATGVMVVVEGNKADANMLRDVCMHITAKNPLVIRREDVSAETVAKEMEIAKAQIAQDPKNANKPANIIEKIAEGKMKTWFAENVLLEQPFVRDDSKTVGDLLKSAGLKFVKFVRYKVGEAG
ncbi:MAG TPA: translation elongation factor Ts [Gemmataceae bacterium]|nr:translation elongation factor Ts [Gemmataceae bacterium]